MIAQALTWRKSSYSNDTGGACVEVAELWRKSSYSDGGHQNRIEVSETSHSVLVRDTQHREFGHLGFGGSAWAAFVADVKAGRV